jgi:hypothetical protein
VLQGNTSAEKLSGTGEFRPDAEFLSNQRAAYYQLAQLSFRAFSLLPNSSDSQDPY